MTQIFLSYSHRDAAFARSVADGLSAEGYTLWWDEALKPADDFGMHIEKQIDASGCVVVVWSNSARDSLWVRAEANAALEGSKLVQVIAEPTKPPLPFTMLHFLDLSRWRGDRESADWKGLTSSCHSTISGGRPQFASVGAEVRPSSMLAPLIAVGAASLGLVILAALLVILMVRSSSGDQLGSVAMASFAAAIVAMSYMMVRVVQIGLASRRQR